MISQGKPSVSDDEVVTVEEMSCFYVDPITGEIQTISFEQDVSDYSVVKSNFLLQSLNNSYFLETIA